MKNTRGEREGGRQPHSQSVSRVIKIISGMGLQHRGVNHHDAKTPAFGWALHRDSRQKRCAIDGHSDSPQDGQTSGYCTEGKPPYGLTANHRDSRKKMYGGGARCQHGGLVPP